VERSLAAGEDQKPDQGYLQEWTCPGAAVSRRAIRRCPKHGDASSFARHSTSGMRVRNKKLKPGGRVLVVDFGPAEREGLLAHFHRHGHVKLRDIIALLREAGLSIVESGAVGIRDLQFVLAMNPSPHMITNTATNGTIPR
jgi:hypothetical protein